MTKTVPQFLAGATAGDAITDHALLLARWLQEMGFSAPLFAQHIHNSVANQVQPLTAYRPAKHGQMVIYHHSIGSDVVDFLRAKAVDICLIYHNVTPPQFFAQIDPAWVRMAQLGEQQLALLHPQTRLALADSAYNEQDLHTAEFTKTGVLPITLAESELNLPDNEGLVARLEKKRPLILFVSRFAPNKKQEDLVKLLYYYRRIRPYAQLVLIGDRWTVKYDQWVEQLVADLGLATAVTLTGKISQQDMLTYYRHADLYISMSEHEGFGKPLIESMYLGLPVLAYDATAVAGTLGDGGVLFREKNYEQLAELVDILIYNQDLRQRLIQRQKQRAQQFKESHVRQLFASYLSALDLSLDS